MDRRDLFLYWWPVTARIVGVVLAGMEMTLLLPPDTNVLGFAGTLIIAPYVAGIQAARNDRRQSEEGS